MGIISDISFCLESGTNRWEEKHLQYPYSQAMTAQRGFSALAKWTAEIPDYEAYMFRRFSRLSARNLQHLESELALLQAQLDAADEEAHDSRADILTRRACENWAVFEERAGNRNFEVDHRKMKLCRKINRKLKQYCELTRCDENLAPGVVQYFNYLLRFIKDETILLQEKIASIGTPHKHQLGVAQRFFKSGLGINPEGTPALGGYDSERLENETDLLTLKPPHERDFLSRFLYNHPGWLKVSISSPLISTAINIQRSTQLPGGLEHFDEGHIYWAVATISTALSVILLIGAIVTLRLVQDEDTRIGLIVAFTVLFGAALGLFTNARRAEVFGATAAYAAVLVVFVSSDIGGSSSSTCECVLTGRNISKT